jgi:hypothetical protein
VEDDEEDEDDVVEGYRRDMSPEPVDPKDLTQPDRRLQVSSEAQFRRALVSNLVLPNPSTSLNEFSVCIAKSNRSFIIQLSTPSGRRRPRVRQSDK